MRRLRREVAHELGLQLGYLDERLLRRPVRIMVPLLAKERARKLPKFQSQLPTYLTWSNVLS